MPVEIFFLKLLLSFINIPYNCYPALHIFALNTELYHVVKKGKFSSGEKSNISCCVYEIATQKLQYGEEESIKWLFISMWLKYSAKEKTTRN